MRIYGVMNLNQQSLRLTRLVGSSLQNMIRFKLNSALVSDSGLSTNRNSRIVTTKMGLRGLVRVTPDFGPRSRYHV